jgi:GntR family transcriptional repressor for pyruvate dehydrogenase complex
MCAPSPFQMVGGKGRLVDRVVNEIQGVILSGDLAPGVKLPPERELTEELGVSRTVIREAVQILVAKGLLETKPGVGTIVRQVTRDQLVEPLSFLLQAHAVSPPDLHQVRQILEVAIAGLAASQAAQADITRMEQILNGMEAVRDDPVAFAAKDADFHHKLAETTHNALLVFLLGSLRDLTHEIRLRVARYPGLAEEVLPSHWRIVERVAAKDPEGAREAMQEHLDQAWRIQEALQEEQTTRDQIG